MIDVIVFGSASAHSEAVVRPVCSVCGTATLLVGIEPEPERRGYELRTFECPTCRHFETAAGKIA